MAEHERRMAKRHEISVAMHQVRTDAPEVRDTDQEYRKLVFDRWVLTMGNGNDGSEEESSGQNEAMSP